VRADDQPRIASEQRLEGGQQGPDLAVVGDARSVQGNVQVGPDQHSLAGDCQVINGSHERIVRLA
jgi:hypothetical protein